ncbi:MAG: dihydrolipoyl dehydrogenase [Bacteroidales bacterium]|nr:dihydrolipoyl dehydrogenase [Bacteroidales bacterium]
MDYDLIIIGAGPAGYVAAIRAGQLGMKTALVEKKAVGGMCLNWGCIPTKVYIESAKLFDRIKSAKAFGIDGIDPAQIAFNWGTTKKRSDDIVKKLTGGVNYLLRKNGVEVIHGQAQLNGPSSVTVNNRLIEGKNILIATGSYPKNLDFQLPDGKSVEVEQLSQLDSFPEKILIYGFGGVALEFAQFFRMINREVTLVSPVKNLLPGVDTYLSSYLLRKTRGRGVQIIEEAQLTVNTDNQLFINDKPADYDLLLNCSWRRAVVPASEVELKLTADGYIQVDEHLQTSIPGVYAAGDVNGLSYLAHVASAQSLYVVNRLQGMPDNLKINQFPINIYTIPEVAQIGLTEGEIREKGIEYRIGEFPMSANGKALAEDSADGLIRVLSEKKYGEVLGVQIIASNATDLIAEAAAFMSVEATVYDVARTIHAHPTVSEVFLEAGLDAADTPIHK